MGKHGENIPERKAGAPSAGTLRGPGGSFTVSNVPHSNGVRARTPLASPHQGVLRTSSRASSLQSNTPGSVIAQRVGGIPRLSNGPGSSGSGSVNVMPETNISGGSSMHAGRMLRPAGASPHGRNVASTSPARQDLPANVANFLEAYRPSDFAQQGQPASTSSGQAPIEAVRQLPTWHEPAHTPLEAGQHDRGSSPMQQASRTRSTLYPLADSPSNHSMDTGYSKDLPIVDVQNGIGKVSLVNPRARTGSPPFSPRTFHPRSHRSGSPSMHLDEAGSHLVPVGLTPPPASPGHPPPTHSPPESHASFPSSCPTKMKMSLLETAFADQQENASCRSQSFASYSERDGMAAPSTGLTTHQVQGMIHAMLATQVQALNETFNAHMKELSASMKESFERVSARLDEHNEQRLSHILRDVESAVTNIQTLSSACEARFENMAETRALIAEHAEKELPVIMNDIDESLKQLHKRIDGLEAANFESLPSGMKHENSLAAGSSEQIYAVRDSVAELAWQLQAEIGERHAFVAHIKDLADENDTLRASVNDTPPRPEDTQVEFSKTPELSGMHRLAQAEDKSAIQEWPRNPPPESPDATKTVRWGWLP